MQLILSIAILQTCPGVPGQKFMNMPTEPAMARVHPACHTSSAQVTSIGRVSLRSPPCVGLTEGALTICPKNELYVWPLTFPNTKELSCVCARDAYQQFREDWRGVCSILYLEMPVQFFTWLALCLLATGCFHTMMNDTVQYVKGKFRKTNEKDKYKLQK